MTMVLRLGEVAVDLVDKGVGVGHAGEGEVWGEPWSTKSAKAFISDMNPCE